MKKLILFLSLLSLSNNKQMKYSDIKGNIKNPGVYEIKENYTIQDVINIAGGLKDNSYTDNINLSKKVTDEMVIYINTKNEIDNIKKLNNCKCAPTYKYIECDYNITSNKTKNNIENKITTTTTKPITTTKITTQTTTTSKITEPIIENYKININTATKEELIKINGLGEVKAISIIEYRTTNGYFKSIEEIMNVKGIGQATFDNIKEYIEV